MGEREWPNYVDFGRIAALRASLGRLYVCVDAVTRARVGEAFAAGGEAWGGACLDQLNEVFEERQPARGLAQTRHAVQVWSTREPPRAGDTEVVLWYRSPVREHTRARRAEWEGTAAPGAQDSAFLHAGQRVVLVHAVWRSARPRPVEPSASGDDVARLHGRTFVVTSVQREHLTGRTPAPGRALLGVRTALVHLAIA